MLSFSLWNYYIEKTDKNGTFRIFECPVYDKVRSAYLTCISCNNDNNEKAHYEIKKEPIRRSFDFDIIEVLKAE